MTTCPVMKLPASEQRSSAGPTISSGWAARRMKAARCMASTRSGAFARTMSVSTVPGASALTRMPSFGEHRGHRPSHRHEAGFGGGVHRGVGREEEHAGRDHVQDRGVLGGFEVGECPLDEEDRTAEVRAERLLPRVDRQLSERERECVGGVVHDDVEPAEFLHGAVDERVDGVDVAHVRGDADRLATERTQMRLGLGARIRPCGWPRRLWPRPRRSPRRWPARSPRASGDDRHPAGQVVQVL